MDVMFIESDSFYPATNSSFQGEKQVERQNWWDCESNILVQTDGGNGGGDTTMGVALGQAVQLEQVGQEVTKAETGTRIGSGIIMQEQEAKPGAEAPLSNTQPIS